MEQVFIKDNSMEKAFKIGICPHCKEKIWFWKLLCDTCYAKIFELIRKNKQPNG